MPDASFCVLARQHAELLRDAIGNARWLCPADLVTLEAVPWARARATPTVSKRCFRDRTARHAAVLPAPFFSLPRRIASARFTYERRSASQCSWRFRRMT